MKVKVGVSNRHIHLSKEDYEYFFGNESFLVKKELSQDGEFSSMYTLNIKTDKNIIKNVRVIGPLRERTQVEISSTDAYFLGINPPVRMSNDLGDALDIILCDEVKEKEIKSSCILAHRHIHVNEREAKELNLCYDKPVKVKIDGIRGGILDNVLVKIKDNYNFELHIDTDEANAFGVKNGEIVEIIEER